MVLSLEEYDSLIKRISVSFYHRNRQSQTHSDLKPGTHVPGSWYTRMLASWAVLGSPGSVCYLVAAQAEETSSMQAMLFSWQEADRCSQRGHKAKPYKHILFLLKYGLYHSCSHSHSPSKLHSHLCPKDNGTKEYIVLTEKHRIIVNK